MCFFFFFKYLQILWFLLLRAGVYVPAPWIWANTQRLRPTEGDRSDVIWLLKLGYKVHAVSCGSLEASTMPGGPPGESTWGALVSIPSFQVIPAPVRGKCMKNFPDDSSSPRSLSLSGSLIGPVTGAEKSHSHVPCLNSQPRNSVSIIRWWWF